MSRLERALDEIKETNLVTGLQFGLMDPEWMRKGSVVEVTTQDTFDAGVPKVGGLFDFRMGVIERGQICPIDQNRDDLNPGYFGHIELALPVFNYSYMTYIIKVLRSVCYRCSNLLLNKSNPDVMQEVLKRSGKARFNYVYNLINKTTNKICDCNDGCKAIQPKKYERETMNSTKVNTTVQAGIVRIYAHFKQDAIRDSELGYHSNRLEMYPSDILRIFSRIKDEDIDFMGFNRKTSRPQWMIIETMPVAPPQVRPSVKQDNSMRSEDDLTHKYADIIKFNKQLQQKIDANAPKKAIDEHHSLLQFSVATLVDNEIPGMPKAAQRSGRPLKSIRQRLKGKTGRIRGNLMGKRVDYSGRTVISVDPNIDIDEFGVPKEIAMILTVPEKVTKWNKANLQKLIANGPAKYPGANSVKKMMNDCNGNPAPCSLSLKYKDGKDIILEEGDMVQRHLQTGDIILCNRQPTLHRMSMMGHRARILPTGHSFRMNVNTTTPYNADFDGKQHFKIRI